MMFVGFQPSRSLTFWGVLLVLLVLLVSQQVVLFISREVFCQSFYCTFGWDTTTFNFQSACVFPMEVVGGLGLEYQK